MAKQTGYQEKFDTFTLTSYEYNLLTKAKQLSTFYKLYKYEV